MREAAAAVGAGRGDIRRACTRRAVLLRGRQGPVAGMTKTGADGAAGTGPGNQVHVTMEEGRLYFAGRSRRRAAVLCTKL